MGMTIDTAITVLGMVEAHGVCIEAKDVAVDTMRKYQKIEDFARWVAEEVIDEELWTYNYLAFAELACRKLVQLGIMQESDGEYTYEVVEDGNND